ncbi:MAG: exopolyphosphatase, partial [Daejeonella sp.]
MKKFKSVIDSYKIKNFKAVATAAVRTAANGKDFVADVKSETGIEIETVTGDKEAALIFEGVKQAVKLGAETCLIMDIGGGSVEFILASTNGIIWKKSYPIGAAKLMALFHHSDPISPEEITQI